jgi:hypothetical protein
MTVEMFVREDKVIRVETTEFERTIDFDDIVGSVEYDEHYTEAPWDNCDGWEHEFHHERSDGFYDDPDKRDSHTRVNCSRYNDDTGYIEVTDEQVIEWGCTGYPGCSKQVRFESIARAKRAATIQLVKWYTYGWHWFSAIAEYGRYSDSCSGIDDPIYAAEVAEECRREVAAQLENDGYIVENQPAPPKRYNQVDSFKDRIRRNLDCS